MREIFLKAHQMTREIKRQYQEVDYRAQFGLCLSYLLKKRKEVKVKTMILKVNHQPSGGKEWVAEITGRDPKYTFKREFLNAVARDWSYSGKTGTTSYELEPGKVYEVNEPWKGRRFVEVQNGEVKTLTAEDVLNRIA